MLKLLLILIFFSKVLVPFLAQAKDIPIIVIAPSKTNQSYGSVGSQVSVIDSENIKNSSESFLNDLLNNEVQGMNIFQLGGKGTNTGIQMRGLPKRYSTIYIDGVKMYDPSTPDNSFYAEGLFTDSIERIEILKGSQSSLYGNSAVGGTINIFTKKGRLGKHQNALIRGGCNNSKDVFYSIDGANEKQNYFVGINYYKTDGISAMNNDSENDDLGNLYFHLGNISEDVLKDGRKQYENGLPGINSLNLTHDTSWGRYLQLSHYYMLLIQFQRTEFIRMLDLMVYQMSMRRKFILMDLIMIQPMIIMSFLEKLKGPY